MALFEILKYSFLSLIWGVLIAILCMALFAFLIKGWYKDATFSPISYLVGVLLFFFLSFQCVLIVGSLKIVSMTDEYERTITSLISSSDDQEVTLKQSSEIIDKLINEYPILNYYISGGQFAGYSATELPHIMTGELRSFMTWYIIRRILWCLGFVVVGALFVIKSLSTKYRSLRRPAVSRDIRRVSRRPRR